MNDRGRFAENRKLRNLFALADRIAGDVWLRETERGNAWIEVRRAAGGQCVVLDFTRDATRDEIEMVTDALDNLTFLLALVSRAAGKVREQEVEIARLNGLIGQSHGADAQRDRPDKRPDYAAQASMLLTNPVFHRFLTEKSDGEVVDDKETADAALKALISITSKKQLHDDDEARARWRDLSAEFSAFERVLT